jgi:mRNA interferase RelE/StbE
MPLRWRTGSTSWQKTHTGCLPLAGYPGVLRVRVGNYRICYRLENGRLLVFGLVISKRGDVYEVIKRHLGR